MKKSLALLGLFTASMFITTISYATTIKLNGATNLFGDSFDTPKSTIIDFLNSQFTQTDTLTLVNSNALSRPVETWFATGATSILLEEIAGYKNSNTFGWYDSNSNDSGLIFSGADDKNAPSKTVTFDPARKIGFYLDSNGVDRMYSEHTKNTEYDYQLTIFQVNNTNKYILGWEDLALHGGTGGDRDYQDMIVSVTVNTAPVPEPATMLLFGTGLAGLAGLRLRNRKK